MCIKEEIEEPDIFTEFGKYTVGESGAIVFSVLEQKKQKSGQFNLFAIVLLGSFGCRSFLSHFVALVSKPSPAFEEDEIQLIALGGILGAIVGVAQLFFLF